VRGLVMAHERPGPEGHAPELTAGAPGMTGVRMGPVWVFEGLFGEKCQLSIGGKAFAGSCVLAQYTRHISPIVRSQQS